MTPNQPAITRATVLATIVGLIAPIADFLRVFGVYDLSSAQQAALTQLAYVLGGVAVAILAHDAHLRAARNSARALEAAAMKTGAAPSGLSAMTWTAPRPGVETTVPVPAPPAPVKRSHRKKES